MHLSFINQISRYHAPITQLAGSREFANAFIVINLFFPSDIHPWN